MFNTTLIACDAMLGMPRVPAAEVIPDVHDLHREMERLHIERTIVRHRACLDNAPEFGNAVLMEETAECSDLLPAWALTNDGFAPDFDPATIMRQLLTAGVKIAWMAPQTHGFSPLPWCAGALYAALQDACVPLLVDYEQLSMDALHEVCAAFPRLRVILLRAPRVGRHRQLYPLLAQHPELYLCLSLTYSVHEGFTDLCNTFGIHRWVFGAGYPEAEGGSSLMSLFYSGLPEAAIRAVAGDNIQRLLDEVNVHV